MLSGVRVSRNDVARSELDRIDHRAPEVWLLVGDDRRYGDAIPAAAWGPQGSRADTMLLCIVRTAGPILILAVPRDVVVDVAPYGRQRLGGLLDYGGRALVHGVRHVTGSPVHHYVELRMGALVELVDAVGGVEISIPRPARDLMSGLELGPGAHLLNGEQALAYARSRQYSEETASASWRPVGADDVGRLERQLALLRALHGRAAAGVRAVEALAVARAIFRNCSLDRTAGVRAVIRFVQALLGRSWETAVLPTKRVVPIDESISPFPPPHWGTASNLALMQPQAGALLAPARSAGLT